MPLHDLEARMRMDGGTPGYLGGLTEGGVYVPTSAEAARYGSRMSRRELLKKGLAIAGGVIVSSPLAYLASGHSNPINPPPVYAQQEAQQTQLEEPLVVPEGFKALKPQDDEFGKFIALLKDEEASKYTLNYKEYLRSIENGRVGVYGDGSGKTWILYHPDWKPKRTVKTTNRVESVEAHLYNIYRRLKTSKSTDDFFESIVFVKRPSSSTAEGNIARFLTVLRNKPPRSVIIPTKEGRVNPTVEYETGVYIDNNTAPLWLLLDVKGKPYIGVEPGITRMPKTEIDEWAGGHDITKGELYRILQDFIKSGYFADDRLHLFNENREASTR